MRARGRGTMLGYTHGLHIAGTMGRHLVCLSRAAAVLMTHLHFVDI